LTHGWFGQQRPSLVQRNFEDGIEFAKTFDRKNRLRTMPRKMESKILNLESALFTKFPCDDLAL
jgi:hypothetical protein